ncbi:BnaA03g11460D [Brassica napus]|uniref:BnaA03g11460D protein n=1 Tax=Brassica napus TaxID=3708 RepID=A0A078HEE6_BRANA|nr:BnaA03g11460D [Brassica napus]
MAEEFKNLMKIWVSAISSVAYCYFLSTRIKAGVFRLLSVLPVCAMFFVLPLFISSSTFCLYTAFFSIRCKFQTHSLLLRSRPSFPTSPKSRPFHCLHLLTHQTSTKP